MNEDAELHAHLFEYQVMLEIALAGPLMTLFTNTANFSVATHVINCFILDGEKYLVDLIVGIYKLKRLTIMSYKD